MENVEEDSNTKLQNELAFLQKEHDRLRQLHQATLAEARAVVVERAALALDLELAQKAEAQRREREAELSAMKAKTAMLHEEHLRLQAETADIQKEYRELRARHEQLLKTNQETERLWEAKWQEVLKRDQPFAEAWKKKSEALEEELARLRRIARERQLGSAAAGQTTPHTATSDGNQQSTKHEHLNVQPPSDTVSNAASATHEGTTSDRSVLSTNNASGKYQRPAVKLLPIKGWLGGCKSLPYRCSR